MGMATTDQWAQPQIVREQIALVQTTLDDMFPQAPEVRLLDETLRTLDRTPWEAGYQRGGAGQALIHPRVLASIWLHALMRRIRTSPPLEYACGHNVLHTELDPSNASSIPVTVRFTESVTGFTASDVSIGNGSLSDFTDSDASCSFDVTPTGDRAVNVSVPANSSTDAASNSASVSTRFRSPVTAPRRRHADCRGHVIGHRSSAKRRS
jgi:hypothetical protein